MFRFVLQKSRGLFVPVLLSLSLVVLPGLRSALSIAGTNRDLRETRAAQGSRVN